jgi:hypothetical protein
MKSTVRGTTKKKKTGRPRTTGPGTSINVRLHDNVLVPLDEWIATQDDPKLSRPEALRRLAEQALAAAPKRSRGK